MIGNFQDGSVPGKIHLKAAWWFLDQKTGIAQLTSLSNMGLLSRFVGMLTDSRSFLLSACEYFRRILCNLLGNDVETACSRHPKWNSWERWSKTFRITMRKTISIFKIINSLKHLYYNEIRKIQLWRR